MEMKRFNVKKVIKTGLFFAIALAFMSSGNLLSSPFRNLFRKKVDSKSIKSLVEEAGKKISNRYLNFTKNQENPLQSFLYYAGIDAMKEFFNENPDFLDLSAKNQEKVLTKTKEEIITNLKQSEDPKAKTIAEALQIIETNEEGKPFLMPENDSDLYKIKEKVNHIKTVDGVTKILIEKLKEDEELFKAVEETVLTHNKEWEV